MKHKYFIQYIDDLNRICQDVCAKYNAFGEDLKQAKQNYASAVPAGYSVREGKRLLEGERLKEAQEAYYEKLNKLQTEARQKIEEVRAAIREHNTEYLAVDPAKVNHAGVLLLGSGTMSEADMVDLANKYWNNPTMLKMISGQIGKRSEFSALKMAIDTFCSPESRLEVFEFGARWVMFTIDAVDYRAESYQAEWEVTYNELKNEMAALDTFKMEV